MMRYQVNEKTKIGEEKKTFDKSYVQLAKRDHEHSAWEISMGREVERAGMMIEASESRSEWSPGHIILNQAVNVDYGGGVAELNASNEEEEKCNDRVHGLNEQ